MFLVYTKHHHDWNKRIGWYPKSFSCQFYAFHVTRGSATHRVQKLKNAGRSYAKAVDAFLRHFVNYSPSPAAIRLYPRCTRVSVNYFRPGGHRILFRSCTPSVYFGSGTSVPALLRHRCHCCCCCCSVRHTEGRRWFAYTHCTVYKRTSFVIAFHQLRWITTFQGDTSIEIAEQVIRVCGMYEILVDWLKRCLLENLMNIRTKLRKWKFYCLRYMLINKP